MARRKRKAKKQTRPKIRRGWGTDKPTTTRIKIKRGWGIDAKITESGKRGRGRGGGVRERKRVIVR